MYMTTDEIRTTYLEFFRKHGHEVVRSSSLVPYNDPTLLWINAGVSALKKYFDGTEKPKCNRICNAQKSIRTNDIENVGKTARHHTFFEMLGNFSIGDYFKEEAIAWAWEFLTSPEWIGFEKERLYVTVYPDDEDAYNQWVKVGMIESHIRKTEDNFWEIGRGPGGPDTELYYDRGEKYDPEHLGEKLFFEDIENDRYIEVWNVVFSQFDCRPGEVPRTEYKELPQKNIDTGMGLERLVALIQDGETNFDTDLFLPIIHATEQYAKFPYSNKEYKMAYRVIGLVIMLIVAPLCLLIVRNCPEGEEKSDEAMAHRASKSQKPKFDKALYKEKRFWLLTAGLFFNSFACVALTMVAGIGIPACQAMRVPPVESLRDE